LGGIYLILSFALIGFYIFFVTRGVYFLRQKALVIVGVYGSTHFLQAFLLIFLLFII
jgi:hypothetical protein